MIQRWTQQGTDLGDEWMDADNGEWVRYDDHAAALAERDAEIAILREDENKLCDGLNRVMDDNGIEFKTTYEQSFSDAFSELTRLRAVADAARTIRNKALVATANASNYWTPERIAAAELGVLNAALSALDAKENGNG